MLVCDIWTNFSGGIFDYAISAYVNLEPWVYPIFFLGIMGYVYMATKSVTAFIVSVFVTLGIFVATTNIFNDVPDLSLFLFIVTVFGLSLVILALILKVVDRI